MMKNLNIKYEGKSISKNEITNFEKSFDFKLPEFFTKFLLKYNGTSVKENNYKGSFSFKTFLPLTSKRSASIENILKGYKSDFHTQDWLPFAMDSGGWVFVISLAKKTYGQVFIDRFDSGEENPFLFVSSSFEEFINSLTEENVPVENIEIKDNTFNDIEKEIVNNEKKIEDENIIEYSKPQNSMKWSDLRSTLDKIQIASLNSTGEKELKELLETIKSSGSITINKQGKNIVITNNNELQDLINTYDPNIKLTDIC